MLLGRPDRQARRGRRRARYSSTCIQFRSGSVTRLSPGRRVVRASGRRPSSRRHAATSASSSAGTSPGRGRARPGRRGSRGGGGRGGVRRRSARQARRRSRASASSTVTACSGRHAGRSSDVRSTPATMPAERVELLDRRVRAVREHGAARREASASAYAPSSRSGQKRSARSRSDGACVNCTDAATPSLPKRATSSGARHCACSIRCRRPRGRHSSRRLLEGVERVAVRAVADRVHRRPASRSAPRGARCPRAPRRDVISTPVPSSISAVCEPSVPSMNTFR